MSLMIFTYLIVYTRWMMKYDIAIIKKIDSILIKQFYQNNKVSRFYILLYLNSTYYRD